MNKKIIISLATIGAVAAIAVGGTIAYFSDTETSTGNTFTAGTLDLTVTSEGTSSGASCTFADEAGEAFIACNDVKPGDSGESTVKFNLQSNPAWACIKVTNVTDIDNTCVEPEVGASGESDCTTVCTTPGCATTNGELDTALNLYVWVDDGDGANEGGVACDNKKNGTEEVIVDNVALSQFITAGGNYVLPVADTSLNTMMKEPLQPGDHCIGIEWSVPDITGNAVQSDSLGADLEFYVEQSRNNDQFTCVGK